jgi:hypothetical protein
LEFAEQKMAEENGEGAAVLPKEIEVEVPLLVRRIIIVEKKSFLSRSKIAVALIFSYLDFYDASMRILRSLSKTTCAFIEANRD